MKRVVAATVLLSVLLLTSGTIATAWTGRKAVLYAEASVMLAENEPYVWGKSDCSGMLWRLLCKVFPELRVHKWFHRTTADAMAGWPWDAVMTRDDIEFGDLLFVGEPRITHVMMGWVEPETAIHASSKRGFSATALKPYWWPRLSVIARPPY